MVALKPISNSHETVDRPPGSRNAVVALKQKRDFPSSSHSERSRNAVVALKPVWIRSSEVSDAEAGTPWWH